MAARTARLSQPDKQGQYARQLGWKLNSKGTRVQHRIPKSEQTLRPTVLPSVGRPTRLIYSA